MLLQVNLGNIREQSIILIWENSPVLAELYQRQLKGECGDCSYKVTCSGCRGRAYEETGDMMATDPGCWLAPEVAKENQKQYERLNKLNHLPKEITLSHHHLGEPLKSKSGPLPESF